MQLNSVIQRVFWSNSSHLYSTTGQYQIIKLMTVASILRNYKLTSG